MLVDIYSKNNDLMSIDDIDTKEMSDKDFWRYCIKAFRELNLKINNIFTPNHEIIYGANPTDDKKAIFLTDTDWGRILFQPSAEQDGIIETFDAYWNNIQKIRKFPDKTPETRILHDRLWVLVLIQKAKYEAYQNQHKVSKCSSPSGSPIASVVSLFGQLCNASKTNILTNLQPVNISKVRKGDFKLITPK